MDFFILSKNIHNNTLDPESPGPKVFPRANGEKIKNADGYFWKNGQEGKIYFENVVDDKPIFDYFFLYNSTYQREYDWILLDAYEFIGSNTLSGRGFLISKRFKKLLEKFDIARPFRFYESKLMYQGKKLPYFIFHLAQNEWKEFNSELSTFKLNDASSEVNNFRDLNALLKKAQTENLKIEFNIVMKEYADIFYFAGYGYLISEKLKNEMEKTEITDFEYIPIENTKFEFQN